MEVENIVIEITRKCNFFCGHCLRGDAENKVLNVESIRGYLIEEKISRIDKLTLTGGEPLSTPSTIVKLVDLFKRLDISVGNYYIATNGSKFNKASMDAVAYLHTYCDDNDISFIEISNSPWHKAERKKLGVHIPRSFEDLLEEKPSINRFLFENYGYKDIMDIRISLDSRQYKQLLKEGRAKTGRKISRMVDFEEGLIYINALGRIIKGCCDLSYKRQADKSY